MLNRAVYMVTGMAVLVAAMSFTVPKQTTVTIRFENYVGNAPLKLDNGTYKNALGQAFTVSEFKYYISRITLHAKNTTDYVSSQYFLIDEEDSATQQITLTDVPEGDYTSLDFTIGIDSLHNCNGAQTGALDPLNGMYWTWNTGYIFMKMTGKSPASHSPGDMLEFHIGGYKQPSNCIRYVKLGLKNGLKNNTIRVKADMSEIFKTPTTIDFSKLSSVTDFHNATTIANNYSDMFSIMQ